MIWLWLSVAVLGVSLALVRSMRFDPSSVTEAQLERAVQAGDKKARREQKRRQVIPVVRAISNIKSAFILVAIAAILFINLPPTQAIGAMVLVVLVVEFMVAKNLLGWFANKLTPVVESKHKAYQSVRPLFVPFIKNTSESKISITAPEELEDLINASNESILSSAQKTRLLGVLGRDTLRIKDFMVNRDDIVTVDYNDTLGPLLLDNLHKTGHKIFPVVKKNIDTVKGYLYLSDVVMVPEDVTKVSEAIRPAKNSLHANDLLIDVVTMSLQSGRQQFIVADDKGKTAGFITLKDALKALLGDLPSPKN